MSNFPKIFTKMYTQDRRKCMRLNENRKIFAKIFFFIKTKCRFFTIMEKCIFGLTLVRGHKFVAAGRGRGAWSQFKRQQKKRGPLPILYNTPKLPIMNDYLYER